MTSAFHWLSPAGAGACLQIFIFHRVLPQVDPLFPDEVTASRFDEICAWIRSWFNVLALDDAVIRLRERRLPPAAAAITFDDGYADNHNVALPILRKHGLTATFFVATGFLNGGRMWNDSIIEAIRSAKGDRLQLEEFGLSGWTDVNSASGRRLAIDKAIGAAKYLAPQVRLELVDRFANRCAARLPTDLMMRDDQVRSLRDQGMTIGAHTVSHPILARLDEVAAESEIDASRQRLQQILDQRVGLFAYPNGKPGVDYLPANAELVERMGFDSAVSTQWGAASWQTSRFELPRFTPWDRSRVRFGLRLAGNLWRSRRR